MAFFPRLVASEFAPMFRLMDDYAQHISTRPSGHSYSQSITNSYRSFTPKFDVKEEKDRYVLEGELPGIAQQDVNIEFTDAATLVIKGRTETVHEEGSRPAAAIEADKTEKPTVTEAESDNASNYHKATVEDETATTESTPVATPATTTDGNDQVVKTTERRDSATEIPQAKYWLSERSVGEFARTFSFPSRVDHDNVKASMKNGILSVVVPKAAVPVNRRVLIE